MGLTKSKEPDMKAAQTLLLPRRDHIIRQLSRIGLKANQLNTKQIIQLFYDIYNFDPNAPVDNFSSTENAMSLVKQAEVGNPVSSPPVNFADQQNQGTPKDKKADMRRLWTIRLNAALRPLGISYSKFIDALNKKNIKLDRKVLSEIAKNDSASFARIVEQVK
jgi:ribosomal protein L20